MSLLLDALKKAAKKKAKAGADTRDRTEGLLMADETTIDEMLDIDDVSKFLDGGLSSDIDATQATKMELTEKLATEAQAKISAQTDTQAFKLVDRGQLTTATTSNSEATDIRFESLKNEGRIVRPKASNTNTFAPDNYDRTFVTGASSNGPENFSRVASEGGILMTPDYAKRVFKGKSSGNQTINYKVYFGIAVGIFLAIAVIALFELQDETDRIEAALMPLKRDPLPGLVRSDDKLRASLYGTEATTKIDNQTLKLLESTHLKRVEENVAQAAEPNKLAVAVVAAQASDSLPVPDTNEKRSKQTVRSLKITTDNKIDQGSQWLSQAYMAYQRGDVEMAAQKYNQVLSIEPNNRDALLGRAAISIQKGNTASAITDYQKLLVDHPKDSLVMSSLISVANISPRKSESQLKLMIRDEPESPYLNFVLANIYGAQNRWQEAQQLYFKALEHSPDDPNYAYNLAVSLEHLSKPKIAIPYYERAVSNIANGSAVFNKAVVSSRIETLKRL